MYGKYIGRGQTICLKLSTLQSYWQFHYKVNHAWQRYAKLGLRSNVARDVYTWGAYITMKGVRNENPHICMFETGKSLHRLGES